MPDSALDFTIERLGPCRFPSPMAGVRFVTDDDHVLYPGTTGELKRWTERGMEPPSFEVAGPRRETFFEPGQARCAQPCSIYRSRITLPNASTPSYSRKSYAAMLALSVTER